MKTKEILNYLEKKIHSVIIATVDDKGLPVTCAIDIMDGDENGLYFLTAKGKGFYNRLKKSGYAALTGMNGRDTLSCVAISVRGKVREIGNAPLQKLFEKNPYMNEIYPTEKSRQALTVFQLYEGSGEWFDLSQKPIILITPSEHSHSQFTNFSNSAGEIAVQSTIVSPAMESFFRKFCITSRFLAYSSGSSYKILLQFKK